MVEREAAKGADFDQTVGGRRVRHLAERMPPPISTAVIDAAHKDGKKAVAHIFYYDNAAELTREGVDVFVHQVRDRASTRR